MLTVTLYMSYTLYMCCPLASTSLLTLEAAPSGNIKDSEKRKLAQKLSGSLPINVSFVPTSIQMKYPGYDPRILLFLVDVLLLKTSSYFIGTQSSNVGRLVAELMAAHDTSHLPLLHDIDNFFWHVGGDLGIDTTIYNKLVKQPKWTLNFP